MDYTPFGGSSVRDHWPYLGAVVVSRAAEGEQVPPAGQLAKAQADALVAGTLGRPIPKMRDLAMALHLARMSPARTAAAWNSYLVSL
eukprot:8228265-Pyramimonas_sp.AAC.1